MTFTTGLSFVLWPDAGGVDEKTRSGGVREKAGVAAVPVSGAPALPGAPAGTAATAGNGEGVSLPLFAPPGALAGAVVAPVPVVGESISRGPAKAVAAPGSLPSSASTAPVALVSTTHPFVWPTPLDVTPATPWEQFAQAAASGDPATGLFGLHRNSGRKFHEGVDIRPARRDRRGEPADIVRAAIPGVVAHIASIPNGPYGRYVVLWHAEPGLRYYTLYAHLRSVSPELRLGNVVDAGTGLGVMGRSDEGRGFPKERAHLHFEAGVRLGHNFGVWYSRQKEFGAPNRQGEWNGINLVGIDPLPLLRHGLATGRAPLFSTYLKGEPAAATVYLPTTRVPAFVRENPALLAAPVPRVLAGWKIEFAWHGLPVRWTPLASLPGPPAGGVAFRFPVAVQGVFGPAFLESTAESGLLRKAVFRGVLGARQPGARKGGGHVTAGPAPGPVLLRHLGILFAEHRS
ncbi:MAG: M23 family metallopeptidase [Puniceicoccales bacterium]|nr:M23 family metallopeptidase [Puniceicoccales bacterium]